MTIKVSFITIKSFDFVNGNGEHIVGCNAMCYDDYSDSIIKVKVVNKSNVEGLSFGDTIEVNAIPSGRYINYEV